MKEAQEMRLTSTVEATRAALAGANANLLVVALPAPVSTTRFLSHRVIANKPEAEGVLP